MKKIVASFIALGVISFGFLSAQTCSGVIRANINDIGGTPISNLVSIKDVAYFEAPNSDVHHIYSHDKMANTHFEGFTAAPHSSFGGSVSTVNATASGVTFPAYCNTYSVQMTLTYDGKDMKIGFYNLPAGKDIDINTITFNEGYYFVDLKGGSGLVASASGKYILTTDVSGFGGQQNMSAH